MTCPVLLESPQKPPIHYTSLERVRKPLLVRLRLIYKSFIIRLSLSFWLTVRRKKRDRKALSAYTSAYLGGHDEDHPYASPRQVDTQNPSEDCSPRQRGTCHGVRRHSERVLLLRSPPPRRLWSRIMPSISPCSWSATGASHILEGTWLSCCKP